MALSDIEDSITYCKNEYEAATAADSIVLLTEWHQFRGMDLSRLLELMNGKLFFDLRNVFAKHSEVRSLFEYYPIGQN